MSDFEDDLKRVLRQRADGDYITSPDAMLGRVHAGAKRLRRRRTAITGMAALALVAAGTGLVLGGNLMNTTPPVVAPSTATPSATPSSAPNSAPSSAPTNEGTAATQPPVGGVTTSNPQPTTATTATTAKATPTPPPTTATSEPPSSGITVTHFQPRSVVPYGRSAFRVLGDAQCDGSQCYPVLVTTDGGRTFALEGVVPGQVFTIGGSGKHRWAYGFGVWESEDSGKTWRRATPERPAGSLGRALTGPGSPVVVAYDGSSLWQGGGGLPYWHRIEQRFARIDDRSVWGRVVVSGDDNGAIGVTVSGTDQVPRPTGCKPVSWARTQVAAGPGDVIWLLCPGAPGEATLRLSTDAGKTWRPVPAKLPRFTGGGNLLAARSATSAVLFSGPSNRIILVTAGGSVRQVRLPGAPGGVQLHFQTSDVGYLCSDGELYRTADGGESWPEVRFAGFE